MQFETNQNRFKICALCNNRIHKDYVVCSEHIKDMELYKHELWFQELCKMNQRQYEIDVEEYRYTNNAIYIPTLQKSSKTRGKQLSNLDKNKIISLYNQGLGDSRISKRLNIPYSTVNKFLYRYRKNTRHLLSR